MNYDLIYCDPPWEYGNTISNGAACNHYGTMGIEDLKRLPLRPVRNAGKRNPNEWRQLYPKQYRGCPDRYQRDGPTTCQHIGKTSCSYLPGRTQREAVGSSEPTGKLYGEVKRIELFAREEWNGWDRWGNECNNSVEMITGQIKQVNHGEYVK